LEKRHRDRRLQPREDMIDPAILTGPGRLDVKIKIERPDAESAQDIFPSTHRATARRMPTTARVRR